MAGNGCDWPAQIRSDEQVTAARIITQAKRHRIQEPSFPVHICMGNLACLNYNQIILHNNDSRNEQSAQELNSRFVGRCHLRSSWFEPGARSAPMSKIMRRPSPSPSRKMERESELVLRTGRPVGPPYVRYVAFHFPATDRSVPLRTNVTRGVRSTHFYQEVSDHPDPSNLRSFGYVTFRHRARSAPFCRQWPSIRCT